MPSGDESDLAAEEPGFVPDRLNLLPPSAEGLLEPLRGAAEQARRKRRPGDAVLGKLRLDLFIDAAPVQVGHESARWSPADLGHVHVDEPKQVLEPVEQAAERGVVRDKVGDQGTQVRRNPVGHRRERVWEASGAGLPIIERGGRVEQFDPATPLVAEVQARSKEDGAKVVIAATGNGPDTGREQEQDARVQREVGPEGLAVSPVDGRDDPLDERRPDRSRRAAGPASAERHRVRQVSRQGGVAVKTTNDGLVRRCRPEIELLAGQRRNQAGGFGVQQIVQPGASSRVRYDLLDLGQELVAHHTGKRTPGSGCDDVRMALKVMLSSVRRGLADVRDAAGPVIKILRYDVIRFETVVKTPMPPRATCVQMVEDSDIYLLILGEEYGDPMPGTGKAPTEEEWTVARNLGKPTVVFKRSGISPGAEQAAFIERVEDYETGVWRYTFTDAADLISQLEGALAVAAEALRPAMAAPLGASVTVPWLESRSGIYTGAGTVLETHVIPVGSIAPLPAATLGDLRRVIAGSGQDGGIFEVGQAIEFTVDETAVIGQADGDRRRPRAGIRIGRNRTVSIWEALPTSLHIGAVLDEVQFVRRVARDLRIAAAMRVLESERVAVTVGFEDVSMLGTPAEFGTGMSLPFAMGGNKGAHPEPTDAWPLRALAVGADDIAREVVAGLMLRLQKG